MDNDLIEFGESHKADDIMVFNHSKFGNIRVAGTAENPEFCAMDQNEMCCMKQSVTHINESVQSEGEYHFSTNGIHVECRFADSENIYSEYDFLAIISSCEDSESFWENLHQLDMMVAPENKTYYILREAIIIERLILKRKEKEEHEKCNTKTYLMSDSRTGYTKIGISNNPKLRERTLQSEKPTVSLLKVCNSNIEKKLHNRYKGKRVRGEWFDLSDKEIKEIISDFSFYDYNKNGSNYGKETTY